MRNLIKLLFVCVGMIASSANVYGQIVIPVSFTSGTVASADQVNANFTTLGAQALNRTGGSVTGNITATAGVTFDGIDIGAALCPTCAATFASVSAGTFTGNLVGTMTGTVTGDVTGSSGSTTGNAATVTNGVYTTGSYSNPSWITSLNAAKVGGGTVDDTEYGYLNGVTSGIQSQLNAITGGTAGVPTGMVGFFALAACPAGWTDYAAGQGRYIVGLVTAGTLEGTAGTALTNQENRATGVHSHTASSTSTVTDAGHTHTYLSAGGSSGSLASGSGASPTVDSNNTGSQVTGITVGTSTTVNNSAGVAGTNAPYIQLLVCKKS